MRSTIKPDIAYCPAEHDQALVNAIGTIAVRHAMLETLIGDVIGMMLRTKPNQTSAVVAHLSFKAKIEMAGSLVHEMEKDINKKEFLLGVISRSDTVSKNRNAFLHQLIGYASDEGEGLYAHQNNARGNPVSVKKNKASAKEANDVATEIGVINMLLVRAVIGDEPWVKDT